MKIVCVATAALALLCVEAGAFETVARVLSVTPAREIVNEPYQSCQGEYESSPSGPSEQRCHMVDHYDIKTMYTVVYEYQGQRFSTKLPYDPGGQLKVNVSVTPK